MISISGLCKKFGTLRAVRNVSFDVQKGEVLCLIGPSGSGKSTVLRCLNLLEEPDEGSIRISSVRFEAGVRHTPEQIRSFRLHTGMVFQNFNLFPHLTVLGNVCEGPITVKKVARAEAISLAEGLLERVGMAEKVHQYPSRLSGGQQQRVAIARALAMQPEVMLFDEPTSALDPELVGEVLSTIERLVSDGMTSIIVTHEMGFCRHIAQRTGFMEGGELVEIAPTECIFRCECSERTRRFINAFLNRNAGM